MNMSSEIKHSPRVSVIVLNWNGWKDTITCLESILESFYVNYQIILVDNGSQDESQNMLHCWAQKMSGGNNIPETGRDDCFKSKRIEVSEYSLQAPKNSDNYLAMPNCEIGLTLILATENLGFSSGCNLGIDYALQQGADFVFLLNNDAMVTSLTLSELVKVSQKTDSAIVGALVLNEDKTTIQFAGSRWPAQLFWFGRLPVPDESVLYWDSCFASGSAMLIRRDLLIRRKECVGLFLDDKFFMYCEELDFCLFGLSLGYKCVIARSATISHCDGKSSGSMRSFYYLTRNRILLANRWLRLRARPIFHLYYLSSRVILIVLHVLSGRKKQAKAVFCGLLDGYRGVYGKWRWHDDVIVY